MTPEALQAKAAQFDALYALDEIDDHEELDSGLQQSMAMLKRKRTEDSPQSNATASARPNPKVRKTEAKPSTLTRTTSAPSLATASGTIEADRPLRRTATATGVSTAKVVAKKGTLLFSRPGLAGLFQGLHFFFFPNTTINPARKKRIQKSQELGAAWEQNFSAAVTHVIVDKSMNYRQLKDFLKLEDVPSHVHVVHEDYTADCMDAGSMVNPTLKRYHIKGYDRVDTPSEPLVRPAASPQLKPAKRDVQAREPQTPSQGTVASVAPESLLGKLASPAQRHGTSIQRSAQVNDSDNALKLAIEEARRMQGLLIDEEEQDGTTSESAKGADTKSIATTTNIPRWQHNFQCMQPAVAKNDSNPNAYTITLLQQMADHYTLVQDTWRPMAYRKAINILRRQPTRISTKEQAEKLPGIGKRLAEKVEEIAHTGLLQRLESAKADPTDMVLASFMKIYGVGYAKAMIFVNKGYTTLDDLRNKAKLDENQKIGLEHYDDFDTRIPRAEVKAHSNVVEKAAKAVDPALQIYTMGSYRRGAETSGDIDLIISHPTWPMSRLRDVLINSLVPRLFKQDFLKCSLARTSKLDGSKWLGASCLPSSTIWRRLDLLLVPANELGAALLYFTGNDIFNRSMRLLARKKGMRLNQRGLYKDVLRGKGSERMTDGDLVEGKDEKKIFAALGVPWLEPHERNR